MRWGLKSNGEKLEELRKNLEDAYARISDLEKRLDVTNARIDRVIDQTDFDLKPKGEGV